MEEEIKVALIGAAATLSAAIISAIAVWKRNRRRCQGQPVANDAWQAGPPPKFVEACDGFLAAVRRKKKELDQEDRLTWRNVVHHRSAFMSLLKISHVKLKAQVPDSATEFSAEMRLNLDRIGVQIRSVLRCLRYWYPWNWTPWGASRSLGVAVLEANKLVELTGKLPSAKFRRRPAQGPEAPPRDSSDKQQFELGS